MQKIEASGFDVTPHLPALDTKACELAALFNSAGFAGQFKVFSFGFYAGMEHYDGYSYPQAFLDMKEQVAQESPYFLLIGRQSDHRGVFTRFWVEVEMPDTGIFSCATEEQKEALKTRLLVAIEFDYFKNGKIPFDYAQTEKKGMEALTEYVLKLFDCCSSENRSICEDCASFNEFDNILKHFGFEHKIVTVENYTLKDEDDGIFKEMVQVYIIDENNKIHNLNNEIKKYIDSLNAYITPIRAEIWAYNSLYCIDILNRVQTLLENEYAKLLVIFNIDDFGNATVFSKIEYDLPVSNEKPKVLVLATKGHGLNLITFKNELIGFIQLGGCVPDVTVSTKIEYPIFTRGDYLIIMGRDRNDIYHMAWGKGEHVYCHYMSIGFQGEVQDWWHYNKPEVALSDAYMRRSAVLDISKVKKDKLRSSTMEKACAFIAYHEIAHCVTGRKHEGNFHPNGLLADANGIYHILGTRETPLPYEEGLWDIYDNLYDLIIDPKSKYSENFRRFHIQICDILK